MTLLDLLIYFLAAMAGGAINAVAGGGTFLTFPLLIFNGLTAFQANIMSTVALWPGSVASAVAYRHQLERDRKRLIKFITISVIGSIIGTATLLLTPERMFEALVPWLLLFATLIFAFGRRKSPLPLREGVGGRKFFLLQFFIAIYGGYFGAGIGILMLAMLQLLGLHQIHRMNALKTVLGCAINGVAVVIFALSGKVLWGLAAVMIAGAVTGGFVGAHLAMRVAPEKMRLIVIAVGTSMTIYFFLKGM